MSSFHSYRTLFHDVETSTGFELSNSVPLSDWTVLHSIRSNALLTCLDRNRPRKFRKYIYVNTSLYVERLDKSVRSIWYRLSIPFGYVRRRANRFWIGLWSVWESPPARYSTTCFRCLCGVCLRSLFTPKLPGARGSWYSLHHLRYSSHCVYLRHSTRHNPCTVTSSNTLCWETWWAIFLLPFQTFSRRALS